ncbi:MAG: hypothetical protein NE327_19445 [Lentisphaeraceae bacterium]|nr:hypothetical protein [Lentisphaeraceae bacterium]
MVFNPIIDISYIVAGGLFLFAFTVYTYWKISANLKNSKRLLLLSCRLLAIAGLIIVLLRPSEQKKSQLPKIEQKTAVLIDSSMSMKQTDTEGQRRFDYARNLIKEHIDKESVDIYQFSTAADKVSFDDLDSYEPVKPDTHFHKSFSHLVSQYSEYSLKQIIVLSDGHDFGGISPQRTAELVKNGHASIYALPIGGEGAVRDLSVLLSASQDFTFINQKLQLTADIRALGCQYNDINIELWKEGEKVDSQKITIEDKKEYSVTFTDTNLKPGCYEYEVRTTVLDAEVDKTNNKSVTYVNFIDKKIKALLLEGEPHWDSTFLRRFLTKSNRVDLDAIVLFSPEKTQTYRSDGKAEELKLARNLEALAKYDLILLGKSVDKFLSAKDVGLLEEYVRDHGGSILFTRGNAFVNDQENSSLQPVLWDEEGFDEINVIATDEGRRLSLFRKIDKLRKEGSDASLPNLEVSRKIASKKPLAVSLANSEDELDLANSPAIIYRRTGRGQVMSFGVEGLWRWRFNQNYDQENDHFAAFWDQCFLWLIHNSTFMPGTEYTFRIDSNNCRLGDKINFNFNVRTSSNLDKETYKVTVSSEEGTAYNLDFSNQNSDNKHRFTTTFTPPKAGKYTAEVKAGGKEFITKFIVNQDLLEEKEVSVDKNYLQELSNSSGGRLISEDDLKDIQSLKKVNVQEIPDERVKLKAAWDKIWVIYLICFFLAVDWYLRRKWGLC